MRYIMFVCVDPDHSAEDAAAAPDIDDWLVAVEPNRVIGDRLRPPATRARCAFAAASGS